MRIVTSQKMREIDKFCIENLKIPSIVLMENAALKVLNNLDVHKNNYFVIICGSGNNGGDGLALARHLWILKKKVEIFLIGDESGLSGDCKVNYDILLSMDIKINHIKNIGDVDELRNATNRCEVIVDAIFGTGLSRKVKDMYEIVISLINVSNKYVISIDIPSGLNADTGNVLGVVVKADKTVSFQFYKKGFLNYDAHNSTGEIIIEKIGIPEFTADEFQIKDYLIQEDDVKKAMTYRNKYSHKGRFGRVSVIAGSKGFTGAAYITTQAVVRSGAGLVTLCCTEAVQQIMSNKFVEAMTVSFKEREKLNEILKKSNVIAIGPGMGNNEGTLKIVTDVLKFTQCPLVIDADGINVLKDKLHLLKDKKAEVVLTPHLGEMSRITGISIEKIEKNRIDIAKKFAKEYGVILLLKGYNTVITNGETVVVNSTGNSAMASGGMGDCLTGIIASFIGQGVKPFEAACISTYIHGYCGDKLSKKMFCVNAQHVLEEVPYAIKELQQQSI
ncbi:NAD(P)H-hydrate dehydratase [Clostridium ganghwense]|uniref:Bifunctional NAD(P)H-hydrate repair enzyme n=1 Tax=Clostridium ganghwense TaxID=312089 RepID=A0ABT4CQF5_9CLOT|nr:NAD(P)H-hydrate dehydratase [Clostridium ganghwense]MCY6371284.1 NAD(P)H-hydrate dehydratase [Clostridium ganghwense]